MLPIKRKEVFEVSHDQSSLSTGVSYKIISQKSDRYCFLKENKK